LPYNRHPLKTSEERFPVLMHLFPFLVAVTCTGKSVRSISVGIKPSRYLASRSWPSGSWGGRSAV